VHSVIDTAANVSDVTQGHDLLRGKEKVVFADAGYQGADKWPEATGVKWQVDMRPSELRALADSGWADLLEQAEKLKASVRAKVEHLFRVINRKIDHVKVRYRGLAKNTAQLVTLYALSNLWMVRKRILQDLQACCTRNTGTGRRTGCKGPKTNGIGGKFSCGFIM
jgi:IS5 family transposase